jgi:hypothetical protein
MPRIMAERSWQKADEERRENRDNQWEVRQYLVHLLGGQNLNKT